MSILWAALLFPINDITTTPEAPPAYVEIAKLDVNKNRDFTYPVATRDRQKKLYPDLAPLSLSLPPAKVFNQLVDLVKKQNEWRMVYADEANFRIEAVATTPVLKFSDDLVIEIRPDGHSSTVHMRSKSRMGRSDLGANYKRIKNFLELVKKSG